MDAAIIYQNRRDIPYYDASTREMRGGPDKIIAYVNGALCAVDREQGLLEPVPLPEPPPEALAEPLPEALVVKPPPEAIDRKSPEEEWDRLIKEVRDLSPQ